MPHMAWVIMRSLGQSVECLEWCYKRNAMQAANMSQKNEISDFLVTTLNVFKIKLILVMYFI